MTDRYHQEKAEIGRSRRVGLSVDKRMAKRGMPRSKAVAATLRRERKIGALLSELPDETPFR